MLRVTIELLPLGDEEHKEKLGEVLIINDGTGTPQIGNYKVRLMKAAKYAKSPGVWKRGIVKDFPRQVLGPYDLLLRALAACIGERNAIRAS